MMETFVKDPDAVLDYNFDWNEEWLNDGETISTFTVTVPTGLTLDTSSQASGVVTAWLSGGTDGKRYTVSCKIVTSAGRTDERSIRIIVGQR